MIILKDGGILIISEEVKEKWAKMYPSADISRVISVLTDNGTFYKCSKQKALKLINKALKEDNKLPFA